MASRKPYPLLDRPWRRLRNYQRPHLMWRRITASEAQSLKTRWAWGEGKNPHVHARVYINRMVCFLVSVCNTERRRVCAKQQCCTLNPALTLPLMYIFFACPVCVHYNSKNKLTVPKAEITLWVEAYLSKSWITVSHPQGVRLAWLSYWAILGANTSNSTRIPFRYL